MHDAVPINGDGVFFIFARKDVNYDIISKT